MLYYEIIVTDKFGHVLVREKRKARSYLKAYNQLICSALSATGQSIKCTDGLNHTNTVTGYYLLRVREQAGDTDMGIRVGSGNTPVDISDFKLETPIEEGIGVGQLSHFECIIGIPSVGAAESAFTVERFCLNNSGGDVTVREIGMYANITSTVIEGTYYACIVRDVLGGAVVIPDGGAITVIYTVKAVE